MASPENRSIFALFPELPTEIRLRVWIFSFPSPRTIYLSTTIHNGRIYFTEYQHRQKSSALLSTSWEARSCYLETHPKLLLHGKISTYFNPHLDTLHFDKKSFAYLLWVVSVLRDCQFMSKQTSKAIRRIETDVDGIDEIVREQRLKDVIGPFLREFSGLEGICWVLQNRGSFYRRFREEEGPAFFVRHENTIWTDAGKAAMVEVERAFGGYRKLNPEVRIPVMKVKVNLPGFLV